MHYPNSAQHDINQICDEIDEASSEALLLESKACTGSVGGVPTGSTRYSCNPTSLSRTIQARSITGDVVG